MLGKIEFPEQNIKSCRSVDPIYRDNILNKVVKYALENEISISLDQMESFDPQYDENYAQNFEDFVRAQNGISTENKNFNCYIEILKDISVRKSVKYFCIMKMLHEELITIQKASELCNDYGLTRISYLELKSDLAKEWNKHWKE